jgi:lipoprotein-anchoring transpeptidase ErfK/SrfK
MDLIFGFVELAGRKMALCRFASMAALLIGIGVSGAPALAQYTLQPTQASPSRAPVAGDQQEVLRPPRSIGADDVTGSIPPARTAMPPELRPDSTVKELPPQFRRTLVEYRTSEPVGTIIIDTPNTYLYLVVENGKAMRYGIGVGREGFTWAGSERISRIAEWPDWNPPAEMIEREPYLPRFMAGGEGNPLGARALYLGKSIYRIHGTNQPSTIGTFVSSGCIRLTNSDIADLYGRVQVGTRVVVLPSGPTTAVAASGSSQR